MLLFETYLLLGLKSPFFKDGSYLFVNHREKKWLLK